MEDWWTVRGERWGVLNLDFKVELKKQGAVSPAELDQYGDADLDAYDGGNWCLTTMRLVPVSRNLVDMIGVEQFVPGVEWGDMANVRIDREDVTENQAREAAIQAVRAMKAARIYVDIEPDSLFAKEATTAPF